MLCFGLLAKAEQESGISIVILCAFELFSFHIEIFPCTVEGFGKPRRQCAHLLKPGLYAGVQNPSFLISKNLYIVVML